MAHLSRVILPCPIENEAGLFATREGCQRVAGGRSEAKTSKHGLIGSHPERGASPLLTEPCYYPNVMLNLAGSRGLFSPSAIAGWRAVVRNFVDRQTSAHLEFKS
jgi:hypothetical protein